MWSLRGLMEHNGHDFIDILKIDIEGAEFASLSTFFDFYESQPRPLSATESPMDFASSGARYEFSGKPLPIGQLQIELHPREYDASTFIPLFHCVAKALKRMFSLQRLFQLPRFPLLVGEDGTSRTPTFLDRAQLGLRPSH